MAGIVVGFIDNPEGRQALELAIEEAQRRETRLIVVHSMRGGPRTKEDEFLAYQDALEAVAADLKERGVDHEIHEYVRDQTPAEDLIAAVEEFDADLLVIGYKRRTATGKVLLGSHAQEVLMNVDLPVLAIRAPE